MRADKKSLILTVGCYVIWGAMPAYWQLLIGVNSLLVLCGRILFSLVFTTGLLAITGRMKRFRDTLFDKEAMRSLVPAALFITVNWGLYIWAVNSGHVIECSLGYYINPLIAFVLGILLFRERCTKLQLTAVALALVGVLISVVTYGDFPFISFGLALSFAAYGAFKKKAHADPLAGIAVETLLITPIALVFSLFFMMDGIQAINTVEAVLLVGAGILTAAPLVLYARSVNHVPFVIVAFFQYISPSMMLVYGIISGETPSISQLISLCFIGLGLVVFSIALVKINKTEMAAIAPPSASQPSMHQ
jgi:chloramphenicol-sensitive protein RarD